MRTRTQSFGDGPILLAETVLRGIGDEHDEKEVGGSKMPGLPPRHEPQDDEEASHIEGAAQDDFIIPMLGTKTESSLWTWESPGKRENKPTMPNVAQFLPIISVLPARAAPFQKGLRMQTS